MSKRFTTGLVVGKFAPLHLGHVLAINRAREQCEHVAIISYSNPEFREFPASLRERWLAQCFPDTTRLVVTDSALRQWFPGTDAALPPNEAPDLVHRDFTARLCTQVLKQRIDAVFTSEAYGPGFAAHLSRRFGEAGLGGQPVAHIEVDKGRVTVPISASRLRKDVWKHWHFLPSLVAATLVRRVVFLGAESSGKSTLATALASEFDTASVPEYGRELWLKKNGKLQFEDMLRIAREQIHREEVAASRARRFLFCDTSPLTTLFYSYELFGRADPELLAAASRAYDYSILCQPDFPYAQDGTRVSPQFSARQQAWLERELNVRGTPFTFAKGSVTERVKAVTAMLDDSNRLP